MTLSGETLGRARALIEDRLGLELPERWRPEIERALAGACAGSGAAATERYLERLETLPEESLEWRRLAERLTVGETYFFRDRAGFEALERDVLPALIASRRAQGTRRLRLWSAGCATGEEPYSLAILLDRLLPDRDDWSLTILATDISAEALETARSGVYRRWSLRETPAWLRDRYFSHRADDRWELDSGIRRLVTFAPLNLATPAYPSLATNTTAVDVIVCRNVLMYFTRDVQRAVVARLHRALLPGGWLAVTAVEGSVELLAPLERVRVGGSLLYRSPSTFPHEPHPEPVPEPAFEPVRELLRREPATQPAAAEAPTREPEANAAGLLLDARGAADRGALEEAERLCRAALELDRLHLEGNLLLAAIAQERSDLPAAFDALRRALYIDPEAAAAHFLLGCLLLRQGDAEAARRHMATVADLVAERPSDELVPGADGLTAGRLAETAAAYLERR